MAATPPVQDLATISRILNAEGARLSDQDNRTPVWVYSRCLPRDNLVVSNVTAGTSNHRYYQYSTSVRRAYERRATAMVWRKWAIALMEVQQSKTEVRCFVEVGR